MLQIWRRGTQVVHGRGCRDCNTQLCIHNASWRDPFTVIFCMYMNHPFQFYSLICPSCQHFDIPKQWTIHEMGWSYVWSLAKRSENTCWQSVTLIQGESSLCHVQRRALGIDESGKIEGDLCRSTRWLQELQICQSATQEEILGMVWETELALVYWNILMVCYMWTNEWFLQSFANSMIAYQESFFGRCRRTLHSTLKFVRCFSDYDF